MPNPNQWQLSRSQCHSNRTKSNPHNFLRRLRFCQSTRICPTRANGPINGRVLVPMISLLVLLLRRLGRHHTDCLMGSFVSSDCDQILMPKTEFRQPLPHKHRHLSRQLMALSAARNRIRNRTLQLQRKYEQNTVLSQFRRKAFQPQGRSNLNLR